MWRLTLDLGRFGIRYGSINPAAVGFEVPELQYYCHNYSTYMMINTRYGALVVL